MQKCWQNVLRVWYCCNSIRVRLLGVLPETERGDPGLEETRRPTQHGTWSSGTFISRRNSSKGIAAVDAETAAGSAEMVESAEE